MAEKPTNKKLYVIGESTIESDGKLNREPKIGGFHKSFKKGLSAPFAVKVYKSCLKQ
jgi:hypothetical protein